MSPGSSRADRRSGAQCLRGGGLRRRRPERSAARRSRAARSSPRGARPGARGRSVERDLLGTGQPLATWRPKAAGTSGRACPRRTAPAAAARRAAGRSRGDRRALEVDVPGRRRGTRAARRPSRRSGWNSSTTRSPTAGSITSRSWNMLQNWQRHGLAPEAVREQAELGAQEPHERVKQRRSHATAGHSSPSAPVRSGAVARSRSRSGRPASYRRCGPAGSPSRVHQPEHDLGEPAGVVGAERGLARRAEPREVRRVHAVARGSARPRSQRTTPGCRRARAAAARRAPRPSSASRSGGGRPARRGSAAAAARPLGSRNMPSKAIA